MTSARLRACLDLLGWTVRHLGRQVGYDHQQVRRWLQGAPIPPHVAHWVEIRASHAERTPAPTDMLTRWRQSA